MTRPMTVGRGRREFPAANRRDTEPGVHLLRHGLYRAKRIAREMHRLLADQVRAEIDSARAAPIELRELDARIERPQARRASGDPDLTEDELAAAIERAQA